MIVNFAFPSSSSRVGGVTMLYELANVLARRGHEVHFAHGPLMPDRVDRLDEITFPFDERVHQYLVDALDDPRLPRGDVVFAPGSGRLGQLVVPVQGFRLIGPIWDRWAFRSHAPKICVASWLVDVGRAFGVPDEQLVHIPLGLDHELFATRTGPYDRSIDVAMLYHPFAEKGWSVGLEALRELAARRPGLQAAVFSLAGPPPDPLPDGVRVLLALDQARLADEVYNATRVVIQSSRHEGFGLTAVEAMACGAALVTTDCGGSRDYAVPGETACVVANGDATGLADCTEALLRDDDGRAALAAAGARFVRKFDWERTGELLEAFLERYVADPASFQHPPGEDRSEEFVL